MRRMLLAAVAVLGLAELTPARAQFVVPPGHHRPHGGFAGFARRADFDKPAKPDPDKPEADPAAEAARLVRRAREAFAAEQYGRAVERLDAAIAARPDDPLPYFLKAQAQFAAGQYAD